VLELEFPNDSTTILPSHQRPRQFVRGTNATEILDAWRTRPGGWGIYGPREFRQRMIEWSGAEGVNGEDEDDLILERVVEALEPIGVVRLRKVPDVSGPVRDPEL
jgi:hypothetical protein